MAFNGPVTVTKDGLECSGELGRCNGALGQGGWRFWSGLERLQDKAGFMSGPGACRLHKKHCVTHRGVRMQIRLIQARQSDHWQFLAYKTLLRAGIKWPAQRGFSLVQLRQGMAWLNAQQQRLQHELRERQREIEERVSRSAAPRDDDAPPPRID
jgi:hypothetical protein